MNEELCHLPGTVAGSALLRCRLVEQYGLAFHFSPQCVASFAAYSLMCPGQRKTRTMLVIEERWSPFRGVVAIGAGRDVAGIGKLCAVNVFMALLTFCGCRLEIHIHHAGLHVRRLVTINAGSPAMGADQGEAGLGMIEFLQVLPG